MERKYLQKEHIYERKIAANYFLSQKFLNQRLTPNIQRTFESQQEETEQPD